MKSNKILCLGIIMVMILSMAGLTAAIERDYVHVSTEIDHESDPDVYGRYIVWRASIDSNSDGTLIYTEPSWIKMQNTITGEVINITEETDVHASQPHVYGTKVIYVAVSGGSLTELHVKIYDITEKTTMVLPYASPLSLTDQENILNVDIYEDWVIINVKGTYNWLYAYNIVTQTPRNIITVNTLNLVGTPTIDDNKVYYTEKDNGDVHSLCVYDLYEGVIDKIRAVAGIGEIKVQGGADYDYMGYTFINSTSDPNSYPAVLDTSFIDITDVINYTGFPPTKTHNYDEPYIQENNTILNDDLTLTYSNVLITRHEAIYNANIGPSYKIIVYDMKYNKSYTLLNSNFAHVISDVWEDVLVWETNENSLVAGAYDVPYINTDIYRTITEIESASNSIGSFIPVAIIVMFVGAMFMIVRQFSGGGESF